MDIIMLKKTLYLLALCLLICSNLSAGSKKPVWISDPYSQYPAHRYLCSVGMANDLKSAKNDALKNIAGFFETRVTAVTKSMESESNSASGSQINSSITTSVKAISEGTLKYTEIKATWQDPTTKTYYALAALDKTAVQALYEKEIVESEDYIANCLFKTDDPLIRFAKLCQAIDKHNATQNALVYYNALAGETGSFLRPAFSMQELKAMRAETAKEIPIKILVVGDESAYLETALRNVIRQLGFSENGISENTEYELSATLETDPQKTIGKQIYQPLRINISLKKGDNLLFSYVDKTEQGGPTIEEANSRSIKVLAKNIENKFNKEFTQYLLSIE